MDTTGNQPGRFGPTGARDESKRCAKNIFISPLLQRKDVTHERTTKPEEDKMSRKPTIHEIRAGYEAQARIDGKEAHFFDRDTLKFFHETMRGLTVEKTKIDGVFAVQTRHSVHYFARLDGPNPGYRHLGTTTPEEA